MNRQRSMSAVAAVLGGVGRTLRSPKAVVLLWLATVVVALPAGVAIHESIRADVGASQEYENLRRAMDLGWLEEYGFRAKGIEKSVTASVLSRAALFDNVEAWFSGDLVLRQPGLVALGGLYALVWMLLLGGLLDHLSAGGGRLVTGSFLAAGGRYFLRLLRLALLAGGAYYLIYRLARRLFPWIEKATRDLTAERSVLGWNLAGAAGIVFLLLLVNMVFDYAKIATVLEGRRSMLLAALRGVRFVVSHPLKTCGVYLTLGVLAALLPVAYFLLAPDPTGGTTIQVVLAFAVGQLYLVARLALRMTFYGGQMALFEAADDGGSRVLQRA